jgi:hypothetical protein
VKGTVRAAATGRSPVTAFCEACDWRWGRGANVGAEVASGPHSDCPPPRPHCSPSADAECSPLTLPLPPWRPASRAASCATRPCGSGPLSRSCCTRPGFGRHFLGLRTDPTAALFRPTLCAAVHRVAAAPTASNPGDRARLGLFQRCGKVDAAMVSGCAAVRAWPPGPGEEEAAGRGARAGAGSGRAAEKPVHTAFSAVGAGLAAAGVQLGRVLRPWAPLGALLAKQAFQCVVLAAPERQRQPAAGAAAAERRRSGAARRRLPRRPGSAAQQDPRRSGSGAWSSGAGVVNTRLHSL